MDINFHKNFSPLYLTLIVMFAMLISDKANAYDENNEAYCLAQNMYFEAGNQPVAGKIAVSQVVINRTNHMNYPSTICGVVYDAKYRENWKGNFVPIRHKCQFSWFCDGKHDRVTDTQAYQKIRQLVKRLLTNRYDGLIEGATHYHADYVNPKWSKTKTLIGQVDDHIFYRWD